jgi:hypothetical protein
MRFGNFFDYSVEALGQCVLTYDEYIQVHARKMLSHDLCAFFFEHVQT